jgi:hypothetical protein
MEVPCGFVFINKNSEATKRFHPTTGEMIKDQKVIRRIPHRKLQGIH